MSFDNISDGDWATTRAAFEAFIAGRSSAGSLPSSHVEEGNMDQTAIEGRVGDVGIRLVRDRGTVFIEAKIDGEWQSSRNLLGLADRIDPRLVAASREPAPATVLARWDEMIEAATASDTVARYEAAITAAVVARLAPSPIVPRFEPSQVDVASRAKAYG